MRALAAAARGPAARNRIVTTITASGHVTWSVVPELLPQSP